MSEFEERPILTVDAVVMTIVDEMLYVLTMDRPFDPFAGVPALPGGYVRPAEDRDARDALKRILRDKIGLEGVYFEQLATFSGADRDPRGWSLSVAWLTLAPYDMLAPLLKHDVVSLMPVKGLQGLAFDHDQIVEAALKRLRGKGAWSVLPAMLLPEWFTIGQLRKCYEIVLDTRLEPRNFERKVEALGLLDTSDELGPSGGGRFGRLRKLKPRPDVNFDRMLS